MNKELISISGELLKKELSKKTLNVELISALGSLYVGTSANELQRMMMGQAPESPIKE
jgi:hypothetical protein